MRAGEGQARGRFQLQEEDLANSRICIQDTEKGNGIQGGSPLEKRPGGREGRTMVSEDAQRCPKAQPAMSSNLKQQY